MKVSALRIALLGWLLVILMVYFSAFYFLSSYRSDFAVFFASIQLLLDGKDIYTAVPVDVFGLNGPPPTSRIILHPNLNPPFFTLLLSPLGLLSYHVAFWVWSILSVCFGVLGVFLLQRTTGKFNVDDVLTLLVMQFAYFPVMANAMIGQTALLVFLLVVAGWVAAREGYDRLSGILLGFAFTIKLFLGLFLICFLVLRRWRLIFWLLGTFVLCSLVGLWVLGLHAYVQYMHALNSVTWQSSSWNASAYGFFSRLLGGAESPSLFDFPLLGKYLYYSFTLVTIAILIWLGRSRSAMTSIADFDLLFSFTIVASLLISPLGWMYYFPLLLIPFFVLFRLSRFFVSQQIFMWSLLIVFALSGFPQLMVPAAYTNKIAITQGSLYFYSLLALAGLLVFGRLVMHNLKPDSTANFISTASFERKYLLYGFFALSAFYLGLGVVLFLM